MIYAEYGFSSKRTKYANIESARRAAYRWCKSNVGEWAMFYKSATSRKPYAGVLCPKNAKEYPVYFRFYGCDDRPGHEHEGYSEDVGVITSDGKVKKFLN